MFSSFRGSSPGARPSGASEDDRSLEKVLMMPDQKVEFVVVIMLCMDRMRKRIVDAFDPSLTATPDVPRHAPPSQWDQSADAPEVPPTYRQATRTLTHEDYLVRKEELRDRELLELQQDALKAFGRWRVQVLKRVGEVLRVRPDAAKAEKARRDIVAPADEDHDDDDLIDLDGSTPAAKPWNRPIKTELAELKEEERTLLVNSLLLLLLSLEHYSAHSRVLLILMSASLHIPRTVLNEREDDIAHGLLVGAQQQMSADDAKRRDNNRNAADKAWKVGLATVAGAAIIGLTGGLAAPVIAGAMGSVLGGIGLGGTAIAGLLGGLAGNFVLVGGLFGAYGGSMTGKMMEKYAKEVEDFEFVPLRQVGQDKHRLRLAIGITGWLTSDEEVHLPWLVLGDQVEGFVLRWEVEVLKTLGFSITAIFKEFAVKYAAFEIVKRTAFAGLLIALWPLGLLRIAKALTNSFSVAQARADRAGEVLADALMHKAQGERPVTLIGYSLGGRVIWSCVRTLAKKRAFGLIESIVIIGAPVTAEGAMWRSIRSVVADRVVNVFSSSDYVLGLVYQTTNATVSAAGLQPVDEVAGIENFDVSDLVSGHLRYRYSIGQILQRVGYEALDPTQIVREKEALAKLDAEERRMKDEARQEKKQKESRQEDAGATPAAEPTDQDWDDMFEESEAKAADLDTSEIERRLREVKLREDNATKHGQRKDGALAAETRHEQSVDNGAASRAVRPTAEDEDSENEGPRITMLDNED